MTRYAEADHGMREIFLTALTHEGEARTAYLHHACGDDARMLAAVTALLGAHGRADELLPMAPASAPLLRPGDRIGDFTIDAPLGRGGFSEVYRATQVTLQRTVALKVTRLHDGGDGGQRLAREARTAGGVHDPHLVDLYLDGTDPARGLAFYAMRYVDGPTLAQVLRRLVAEAPPPPIVRRALVARCREVCRALEALHARGLVHRDVAPANVILEDADADAPWTAPARLLDYGLVRPMHASVSMPFGTVGYAAPEITASATVDARADVFGVGALLHALLSARDPATRAPGPRFTTLREDIPGLDRDLEAILRRCVADAPAERYADARELGAELDAWLTGRPTRGGVRRARARTALICLTALVLVFATASTIATRARAARLWDEGALVAATSLTRTLPLRLAGFLIPPSLRGPYSEPVDAVLREGARNGDAAALVLAARHLERDGLASHPLLGRFLHWALDPGSARPDLLPSAHRLAGRLFFERPDACDADVAASRPLAATLAKSLRVVDPEVRAWTLVALGGCGTAADLAAIAAAAPDPDLEVAHLAAEALAEIIRRSVACGFAAALDASRLADVVGNVIAAVRAQHPSPHTIAACGLDWLAVDAILTLRRHGRIDAARPLLDALAPAPALVRAAVGDPDLRAALLADGPEPPIDHNDMAAYGVFHAYGRLVGAFTEEAMHAPARALVTNTALRRGLTAEFAEALFDTAHAELLARASGHAPALAPDPESHLGADLALAPPPWRPVLCAHEVDDVSGSTIASWHFDAGQPRLEARARALAARAVDLAVAEEMRPGYTFARLATFGVSALRLEFDTAPGDAVPGFVMAGQKGIRTRLPGQGDVGIDVVLDGRRVARIPLSRPSMEYVHLPLGATPAGRHVLEVSMRAESTTTLRIVRIAIER